MMEYRRIGITRRQFLGCAAASAAVAGLSFRNRAGPGVPNADAPNVLFIVVDDLRPQLGCYGNGFIQSPNIDGLASGGVTFTRAYCQQALCNPSRASLMTGLRPDTLRVYDIRTHFRTTTPDAVTLPQHFKNQRYHTQGLSKVYHATLQDDGSWTAPWWGPDYLVMERAGLGLRPDERAPASRSMDVPDEGLPDGETAQRACGLLGELRDKPFFLAVGFRKPHLPFMAPRRYFDLYPAESIATAPNPFAPANAPAVALHNSEELRGYQGIAKQGPLPEDQARELIRGYYACVSYVDAQVGRLLRRLEELGLDKRTIVILWGDHGYHLGEHGLWTKHTNFEEAVRAPLIVRAPNHTRPGAKTNALVEFVDVYPTLTELAGLPARAELEGTSFAPLLEAPDRPWKTAAFSQYPRNVEGVGPVMGHSMRTDRYRFTEWRGTEKDFLARELYDHEADPGENLNLAGMPENQSIVAQLSAELQAGWKGALPPPA